MAKSYVCSHCKKGVPTIKGISSHISQWKSCRDALWRLVNKQPPQTKSSDAEEDDQSADDVQMEVDNELMMFESGSVGKGVSQPPIRRMQMEEVEDEEAGGFQRYVEDYGDAGDAGKQFGECQSKFLQWREAQMKAQLEPWAPFEDLEKWDLAQ